MNHIPVNRAEDGEPLGFIAETSHGWQAQTIFGYPFASAPTRAGAEQIVRNKGLEILTEKWQYFAGGEWHRCLLKEVSPTKVTVIRINDYGYPDPENPHIAQITDFSQIKR